MNVAEMYTYVYDYLRGDENTWPKSQVLRYLNDAQLSVFHKVVNKQQRFFETSDTVDEVNGTGTYPMPTGVYKILHLMRLRSRLGAEFEDPVELHHIPGSADEIERTAWERHTWRGIRSIGGAFVEGYFTNGTSEFTLVPESAVTQTAAFQVTYVYRPADLVNDSDIPFSNAAGTAQGLDSYHHLLPLRATAMISASEKDFQQQSSLRAQVAEVEFELNEHLAMLNAQANRRVLWVDDEEDDY